MKNIFRYSHEEISTIGCMSNTKKIWLCISIPIKGFMEFGLLILVFFFKHSG